MDYFSSDYGELVSPAPEASSRAFAIAPSAIRRYVAIWFSWLRRSMPWRPSILRGSSVFTQVNNFHGAGLFGGREDGGLGH